MTTRTVVAVLGAAAVGLVGSGLALAHDEVASTFPKAGAALPHLPKTVSATYGEPLGRLTSATVTRNGKGNLVASARIDPTNAARAVATLKRPGRRWQPGAYAITWRAVAADGHAQTLKVSFTVTTR